MKNRARRVLICLKPFKICLPSIHAFKKKKKGKKVLKLQKGKKKKKERESLNVFNAFKMFLPEQQGVLFLWPVWWLNLT